MVSTTFETRQALELELPESASGEAAEPSPVTLVITAAGAYRLGERELSPAELPGALAAEADQAREHELVDVANGRARHADEVRALDPASLQGIHGVRIAHTTVAPSGPSATPRPGVHTC